MDKKCLAHAAQKVASDLLLKSVANSIQSLRKKADFFHLKSEGKRLRPHPRIQVQFLVQRDVGLGEGFRLGISVSKKVANAVGRNRIKRWVRESLRLKLKEGFFLSADVHVIIFPKNPKIPADELSFGTFQFMADALFKKLQSSR